MPVNTYCTKHVKHTIHHRNIHFKVHTESVLFLMMHRIQPWSSNYKDQNQEDTRLLYHILTLSCSWTSPPLSSKKPATSAWPLSTALIRGVLPHCLLREGMEYDTRWCLTVCDMYTGATLQPQVCQYSRLYSTWYICNLHIGNHVLSRNATVTVSEWSKFSLLELERHCCHKYELTMSLCSITCDN